MSQKAFPKLLGTGTLNDKGQIVIPAEARAFMDVQPGSKMLILGSESRHGLMLVKAEDLQAMVRDLKKALAEFDEFDK